jgi:hypothetical protein
MVPGVTVDVLVGTGVLVGGVPVTVATLQAGIVKISLVPAVTLAVLQECCKKRLPVSFCKPIVALFPPPVTVP